MESNLPLYLSVIAVAIASIGTMAAAVMTCLSIKNARYNKLFVKASAALLDEMANIARVMTDPKINIFFGPIDMGQPGPEEDWPPTLIDGVYKFISPDHKVLHVIN